MIGVIGYGNVGLGIDRLLALVLVVLVFSSTVFLRGSFKIKKGNLVIFCLLLLMCLPALLQNSIITMYLNNSSSTLAFSSVETNSLNISSILKLIQIFFSYFFIIILVSEVSKLSNKRRFDYVLISMFIISASAFLDFIPGILDLYNLIKVNPSYPTIVAGIETTGMTRLSGLTAEPSHLVVFSAAGLIMCLCKYTFSNERFGLRWYLAGILFLVISIFTSSPSALLLLLPTVYSIVFTKGKMLKKLTIIMFVVLFFLWAFFTGFLDVMYITYLGKLGISVASESYSELRYLSLLYAFEVGASHPIFGVGLGNFGLTVGLPALIFASTGVFGIGVTIWFMSRYTIKINQIGSFYLLQDKYIWISFKNIALGILLMSIATKGMNVLTHIPYLVLIALSISSAVVQKKH
jgi:hypothetical protein